MKNFKLVMANHASGYHCLCAVLLPLVEWLLRICSQKFPIVISTSNARVCCAVMNVRPKTRTDLCFFLFPLVTLLPSSAAPIDWISVYCYCLLLLSARTTCSAPLHAVWWISLGSTKPNGISWRSWWRATNSWSRSRYNSMKRKGDTCSTQRSFDA